MSASKKMDSGYEKEIKKERILNIIKHNTCDSEEDNGVSNMPTNYLTPRLIFLIPESIRESVSHTAVQIISESEEQVHISQINKEIKELTKNPSVVG